MATRGELRKALRDWQQWLNKNSHLIVPRSSLFSQQKDLCLALTGVRRSGKSSISSMRPAAAKAVLARLVVPTVELLDVHAEVYRMCVPHLSPGPMPNALPGRKIANA